MNFFRRDEGRFGKLGLVYVGLKVCCAGDEGELDGLESGFLFYLFRAGWRCGNGGGWAL